MVHAVVAGDDFTRIRAFEDPTLQALKRGIARLTSNQSIAHAGLLLAVFLRREREVLLHVTSLVYKMYCFSAQMATHAQLGKNACHSSRSFTIKLKFDKKTENVIVWDGQVVMSRTEEPYFRRLFQRVARHVSAKCVLEIGYGLGISAGLIQELLRPTAHHIVEIEEGIYVDLCSFAQAHPKVIPHFGDWACHCASGSRFDLIFYDPFEYLSSQKLDAATEGQRLAQLLAPNGVLCHPHFGDGPPRELPGFSTEVMERFMTSPVLMADGTECKEVAVVLKRPL